MLYFISESLQNKIMAQLVSVLFGQHYCTNAPYVTYWLLSATAKVGLRNYCEINADSEQ